ncbi:MAG: restriction endonuclease subunit R [Spirulinaceae cyanobacterium]
MVKTTALDQITLYDLEQQWGLEMSTDPNFFTEWQENLPVLTAVECQQLQRVEAAYNNLEKRALLEEIVKLAVVSPLLNLAGFFLAPFYIETEKSIEITVENDDFVLRGRIDILVVCDRVWVLTIESKRGEFSLKVGIPQVLSYMLAAPTNQKMLYGMVTNGGSFIFLKLVRGDRLLYGRSKLFILGQDNGLEQTLQVMKHLAEILQD